MITSPIVVTGGTGTIGRHVVALLTASGHEVRVLTRHPGVDSPGMYHVVGDVGTGRGVEAALRGAGTVVHLAGGRKGDDTAARLFAGLSRDAGIGHLVLISVVGADRMPVGYFRMKTRAEQAVAESGVPWTILRSAQLHDFVATVLRGMARLPAVPTPQDVRFEPIAVEAVAARLVELSQHGPAGRVPDIAGPDVLPFADLLAGYLRATGRRRTQLRFRLPGRAGRAYRAGENLADVGASRAGSTWQQYLDELTARTADSAAGMADGRLRR